MLKLTGKLPISQHNNSEVGRLAQALLDLKLPAGKPIVVLSDNAVDHALLVMASMHVGRAVCTVCSAYCRLTTDYPKVHGMFDALDPALIYAADPQVYGPAIATWRGKVAVLGGLKFEARHGATCKVSPKWEPTTRT